MTSQNPKPATSFSQTIARFLFYLKTDEGQKNATNRKKQKHQMLISFLANLKAAKRKYVEDALAGHGPLKM
jgi:hypothetical protein